MLSYMKFGQVAQEKMSFENSLRTGARQTDERTTDKDQSQ